MWHVLRLIIRCNCPRRFYRRQHANLVALDTVSCICATVFLLWLGFVQQELSAILSARPWLVSTLHEPSPVVCQSPDDSCATLHDLFRAILNSPTSCVSDPTDHVPRVRCAICEFVVVGLGEDPIGCAGSDERDMSRRAGINRGRK